MKYLLPLASGLNVKPLSLALKRNAALWNRYNARTTVGDSPHAGADDIWVRYAASLEEGKVPHDSVWYPEAILALPTVRDLVFQIMAMVQGERLGGVLITRVPAGGKIAPHSDHSWHAHHYDKFAVQIESHQQQAFHFHDGGFSAAPGDLYWFNNQAEHWVTNDSPVDRITMIVCIKTNQFNQAACAEKG